MEKPVEAELIYEEPTGDPDNQDTGASSHHVVPEYQDAESSAHPEVPKDQYADASYHHEMSLTGYRNDKNAQKTPQYVKTIDIDVENIDKNYKNTWRNIYEAIIAPDFGENKRFSKSFLITVKIIQISHKTFQPKS